MSNQEKLPFEFFVVMAVYNVGPWLREAVDSLVQQDFGVERIQLIMIDDGSTDDSGAICDEYAERYPENVMVIHKENGGVSAARNDGLKYVQGRFVNFLDSDDKFAKNTFSSVYKFFVHNEEDTDVVAVPRFYFEGKTGAHDLNYRFRKGTRLIDLRKDYTAIQNTTSTAFFSKQGLEGIEYETGLAYCEDTLFVAMVLLKKMKIGVVKRGARYTRKRIAGELSATQKMEEDKNYYLATMEHLTKSLIRKCICNYGYVPHFIQFLLMNELQWKIIAQKPLCPPLTEEEYKKCLCEFQDILQYIDEEVIHAQKTMNQEFKIFCLKMKYKKEPEQYIRNHDILFHYGNYDEFYLSKAKCFLDFLTIEKNQLVVEGSILCPIQDIEMTVGLSVNGEFFECTQVQRHEEKYSFEILIRKIFGFKIELPLIRLAEGHNTIKICCKIDSLIIPMKKIVCGQYTAVSPKAWLEICITFKLAI